LQVSDKITFMRIAVVGATGLVGKEILEVLIRAKFNIQELIPVASYRSVGGSVAFREEEIKVVGIEDAYNREPDIAIFSAGAGTSLEYAPRFSERGTFVIDNSSAWRMHQNVPLIVPEINGDILNADHRIIANPNCSTIQLVMVLGPLNLENKIRRIVIATYQSVTGSGHRGMQQLENERNNIESEKFYPHPIDLNIIPHAGKFDDQGYTSEEVKLVDETRKILNEPDLAVTATVVRVPVTGAHSEAVNIEFENTADPMEVKKILESAKGVTVQDNPPGAIYPMPLYSRGKDDVFVGRIRKDLSCDSGINLWIVSDNLRKGAATNAVQIAEYLWEKQIVQSAH